MRWEWECREPWDSYREPLPLLAHRASVVGQMVLSPEVLTTFSAVVRLLVIVNKLMSFELIGVGEVVVTLCALIRLFPRVDPEVASKVGHLNKQPVAVRAGVRLLSCVQPHVGFKVVVPGESLGTDLALKGLLPRVSPLVVLKKVRSGH